MQDVLKLAAAQLKQSLEKWQNKLEKLSPKDRLAFAPMERKVNDFLKADLSPQESNAKATQLIQELQQYATP